QAVGRLKHGTRRGSASNQERASCPAFSVCSLFQASAYLGRQKAAEAAARYNRRMRTPPKILATRVVDRSRFLRAEQVDLEFSNGERRTFERLQSSGLGAVIIVPMLDD